MGRRKGGAIKDRVAAMKARVAARPGVAKAKAVIQKVKAARAKGEADSSVKGGRMRKKASKQFMKAGGKGKC